MAAVSGGLSFTSILTIVFVVLKLVDKLDWPWFAWQFWVPSVFIMWTIGLWILVASLVVIAIVSVLDR